MPPLEKQLEDLLVDQHNGAKKIIEEVKKAAESKEITQLKERIEAIERAVLPVAEKANKKTDEAIKATKDLTEAIKSTPKPDASVIEVKAPDVTVKAPIVNVPAPIVNVEQKPPIVSIDMSETNELLKDVVKEVKKKDQEQPELEISREIIEELKDDGDTIVEKIKDKISFDDLKDVPNKSTSSRSTPVNKDGANVSGDTQSVNYTGSSVTITDDGSGNITVDAPANETKRVRLTDQVDGATDVFTTPDSYQTGSVILISSQAPFILDPGVDYIESGDKEITITPNGTLVTLKVGQTLVTLYAKKQNNN